MQWAEDTIYMSWDGYYTASDFLLGIGQKEIAASYVRNASNMLIDQYGIDPIATYENALALAGILLNEPYSRYEKAIPLYRRIIDLEPRALERLLRAGRSAAGKGRRAGRAEPARTVSSSVRTGAAPIRSRRHLAQRTAKKRIG